MRNSLLVISVCVGMRVNGGNESKERKEDAKGEVERLMNENKKVEYKEKMRIEMTKK